MSATKNKVDGVINKYGSNVTMLTKTISATLDEWGEPVITGSSSTTIKAVKDQNLIKQLTLQSAGRVKGASASLIVKSDVTVDARTTKFSFDSQTYVVLAVQSLEMSGEVLAQIIDVAVEL